jgi:hypothetical protein
MDAEKDIMVLTESIRKQRQIAHGLLDEAKKIDDLVQAESNTETKEKLENAKKGVLQLARALVANTTATSSSVQSTFELISNLAKK